MDPGSGAATVILIWTGQPGERVMLQTGTTLGQGEDLSETIFGDTLHVRVRHQSAAPSPGRFGRLRAADPMRWPVPAVPCVSMARMGWPRWRTIRTSMPIR